MTHASFAMKTALIASIILSGKTFAQQLPDEVNHPVYLRTYQNLEQVLNQKTQEYSKLAAEKAAIEKTIGEMEADQVALPRRNAELENIISGKRQELARIENDIRGVEAVLQQLLQQLQQIDSVLAQLNQDLQGEGQRNQHIQVARQQSAANVARINQALNAEIREENQSINHLNVLNAEIENNLGKRNAAALERQDLIRDVDVFKRQLPGQKKKIADNTTAINAKKPALTEAQGKLAPLKAQITQEEGKVVALDAEIAPKKTKLAELKKQLSDAMPELGKLEKENKDLAAKIDANKKKIDAAGVPALKTKKEALEKEVSDLQEKIKTLSEAIVSMKEALKPDLAQSLELRSQIRKLEATSPNSPELPRLRQEFDAIEKRIAPKRQEIARQEKLHEQASLAILPKQTELETAKTNLANAEASVATLTQENTEAAAKIAANQAQIDQMAAANAPLVKEIKDLEAAIAALEVNRDKAAKAVAELKVQESNLTKQIATLTAEIKSLETETAQLTKSVADMEKAIADFPINNRRLENLIQKLDENVAAKRLEVSREEKLLARIRESRMAIERDLQANNAQLGQITADLEQSNRVIASIQQSIQKNQSERLALTQRNSDGVARYDGLKAAKAAAEKVVADASQEISINDQDIATIAQQLPVLKRDLGALTPKVAAAEKSMQDAQKRADDANGQYQSRLSLYNRYLSESAQLGADRASAIASTDGVNAGGSEGKAKASKLASENASVHAKWEALQRGYVRGEIAGYSEGFETGLQNEGSATLGHNQGTAAGQKRAKDHADKVLKPQYYVEEMDRRLVEDQVGKSNSKINLSFADAVNMNMSAAMRVEARPVNIPELSSQEWSQSRSIPSSLDSMIEQATAQSDEILRVRGRLQDPRQAYAAPGAGANAQNANCTGVYKNVKDFVDACKGSYIGKYPQVYAATHASSFNAEYSKTFSGQIEAVFASEIARLYPGYLKDATAVGRNVGEAAGKEEIRSQSFQRAEADAYRATLPKEDDRVSAEAVAMVEKHLTSNAALTVKGDAKLIAKSEFGIAPGTDIDLKMIVKNIGSKASTGNSLVKITNASNSLVIASRQAALGQVAPKSQAELQVLALKVNDTAVPGSTIVISGEIVHPGNDYSATRVEKFKVEAVLKVNPAVETELVHTSAPNVATLGILKKHDIDVVVRPKHEGVSEGYEVSVEEIGSTYVKFSSSRSMTSQLARGESKKVTFEYKLDKASKGKNINLKATIKNGGVVIKTHEFSIKPK